MADIVAPAIEAYAVAHTTPEPHYLAAVAAQTRATMEAHGMMVGPLEGRFLEAMVAALKARQVLEIGTFTGYSALAMAPALAPGGRIITCEVDPEHAAMARRHFDSSPFADRIELRLGPALDTLAQLSGPFDFVFIDADKGSYRDYYEAVLPKLDEGGVIAVDNVLWRGRVLDPGDPDAGDDAKVLAAFNDAVVADDRVVVVLLPVRDGVALIRRSQP